MSFYAFVERNKHHPLPIGRNMWEPVVIFVVENLFLSAAIRLHPPDLHQSRAYRVEVDIIPIWRIFRAIVQAFGRSQASLISATYWNRINIKLAVTLGTICQPLSIWSPT